MFNPFKNQQQNESQNNRVNSSNSSMYEQTMMPGGSVFDENKIDFQLNGGPKYTDVLVASAMFNEGENKGFA